MAYRLAKRAEADLERYRLLHRQGKRQPRNRQACHRVHHGPISPAWGQSLRRPSSRRRSGPRPQKLSGRPIYHRLPRLRPGRAYPARGTQPPGHRGAIRPLSGAREGPQGPPHSRSALPTILFGLLKVIMSLHCHGIGQDTHRFSNVTVSPQSVFISFPGRPSYVSQKTKCD